MKEAQGVYLNEAKKAHEAAQREKANERAKNKLKLHHELIISECN